MSAVFQLKAGKSAHSGTIPSARSAEKKATTTKKSAIAVEKTLRRYASLSPKTPKERRKNTALPACYSRLTTDASGKSQVVSGRAK